MVIYSLNNELSKAFEGTNVVVSALKFDPKSAGFYDSQASLLAAAKEEFILSEYCRDT